jgi:cell division protein FtsB
MADFCNSLMDDRSRLEQENEALRQEIADLRSSIVDLATGSVMDMGNIECLRVQIATLTRERDEARAALANNPHGCYYQEHRCIFCGKADE